MARRTASHKQQVVRVVLQTLVSDGGHRGWPLQPSPKDALRGKDVLEHVQPDQIGCESRSTTAPPTPSAPWDSWTVERIAAAAGDPPRISPEYKALSQVRLFDIARSSESPAGCAKIGCRCDDTSSSSPPSEQPDSYYCSLRPQLPDQESSSQRVPLSSPPGRRPPSSGLPAQGRGARAAVCAGRHFRAPGTKRPPSRGGGRSSGAAARPRSGRSWYAVATPSC
jgi:hypothetical protein